MKSFLTILAFLLSFLLVGASVYIIIIQPQNKDAWGWLMACGFMIGAGAVNSID